MNASSSGQSVRRRRRLAATAVRDVANRRRSFHRQAIKKRVNGTICMGQRGKRRSTSDNRSRRRRMKSRAGGHLIRQVCGRLAAGACNGGAYLVGDYSLRPSNLEECADLGAYCDALNRNSATESGSVGGHLGAAAGGAPSALTNKHARHDKTLVHVLQMHLISPWKRYERGRGGEAPTTTAEYPIAAGSRTNEKGAQQEEKEKLCRIREAAL